VPCGLIVNELVTNALKHAFPNNKPGVAGEEICKITVSMQEMDGIYTLIVADNGVGLSKDIQWESSTSLGLRLFRMLGEHQLGGKITLDRTKGTQFKLVFKLKEKGSNYD
jgi:two-component sensor histidine kinase